MSSKSSRIESHGSLNIQKTGSIYVDKTGSMVLSNPTGISIAKPATVTQATSIATTVVVTGSAGNIVTFTTGTVAGNATISIPVTNPAVTTTSVIILTVNDYSGAVGTNGVPVLNVDTVTAGGFSIFLSNAHASNSISGTFRIGYLIL